jgi:hypothetical protein
MADNGPSPLGAAGVLILAFLAVSAPAVPAAAAAPPAVHELAPRDGAITVGSAVEIRLRLTPGSRIVMTLNGHRVRGTEVPGRPSVWRARATRANGLTPGRNLVLYTVRGGTSVVRGSVRFDHARPDRTVGRFVISRLSGGPIRVTATAARRGSVFRAWLNGRPVSLKESLANLRVARASLGASDGLRHGRNTLRLQVLGPRGGVDTEVHRFGVPLSHAVAGAGADARGVVGLGVPLRSIVLHSRAQTGRPQLAVESASYRWRITAAPPGSRPSLENPTSATPTLRASEPGVYTTSLTVTDRNGVVAMDEQQTTVTPSPLVPVSTQTRRQVAGADMVGIAIGGSYFGVPATAGQGHLVAISVDRVHLGTPRVIVQRTLNRPSDVAQAVSAAAPLGGSARLVIVSYQPPPWPGGGDTRTDPGPLPVWLRGVGGGRTIVPWNPQSLIGVPGMPADTAWMRFVDAAPPDARMTGYLGLTARAGSADPVYGFISPDRLGVTVVPGTGAEPAALTVNGISHASGDPNPGLLVGIVNPLRGELAAAPVFYATGHPDPITAVGEQKRLAADLAPLGTGDVVLVASQGPWMRGSAMDIPSLDSMMTVIEAAGGSKNAFAFSAFPGMGLFVRDGTEVMRLSAGVAQSTSDPVPYGLIGMVRTDVGIEASPTIPNSSEQGVASAVLRPNRIGTFDTPVGGSGSGADAPGLVDAALMPPAPVPPDSSGDFESVAKVVFLGLGPDSWWEEGQGRASDALRAGYLDVTRLISLNDQANSTCPLADPRPGCRDLRAELRALRQLDALKAAMTQSLTTAQVAVSYAPISQQLARAITPPPPSKTAFLVTAILTDVAKVAGPIASASGSPILAGGLNALGQIGGIAQGQLQSSDGSPAEAVQASAAEFDATVKDGFGTQVANLAHLRDQIASDPARIAAFAQALRDGAFGDLATTDQSASVAALERSIKKQYYAHLLPMWVAMYSLPDDAQLANLRGWGGVWCLERQASRRPVPLASRWYRFRTFINRSGYPEALWDTRFIYTLTKSSADADVAGPIFGPTTDPAGLGQYLPRFYADAYGTQEPPISSAYRPYIPGPYGPYPAGYPRNGPWGYESC